MMLHPDHMMVIARQRQEALLASNEPFVIHKDIGAAVRLTRWQIGLALIRLGSWLGGHASVPASTARLSSPQP